MKAAVWTMRMVSLLAVLSLLVACSKESSHTSTPDAGPDPMADIDVPSADVGDTCLHSDECPGQFCDKRYGGCVDCYTTRHCPDEQVCFLGACVPSTLCEDDGDCDEGVCGSDGLCAECLKTADCPMGLMCVSEVCRPPYPSCEEYADCEPLGAVCLEGIGQCGDCTDMSQCGDYEWCEDNACSPNYCTPSEADCMGDHIRICRADGKGYSLVLCEDGETCFAGACIDNACTPGAAVCQGYQVKQCLPNGTWLVTSCPAGEECLEDACQQMRHRVLVVFDTSGSMGWYPGTTEWPKLCGAEPDGECILPWPTCEDPDAPITTMGISKRVFHEFFTEENDGVLFALNRFPQIPDQASPLCEGGFNTPFVEMTDDDGSFSLPMGVETWFDTHLREINLVPFPATGAATNLSELAKWLDFSEWLVQTDQPCTDPLDCPDGVCLGLSIGDKKCQVFANPELRATGWTPLGKSLFYAGEYMRRYVVVDGKTCHYDIDCGSPGYYCNEQKKCFDPLRECRLNVIVLFTDGGETEHPLPSDYFSPHVQAKRLRYGLGCTVDEDCSELDYCEQNVNDPGTFGCHPTHCHPTGGYCTNDLIDSDPAAPITLTTAGPQDRLRDYNGNGIELIINVVDASINSVHQSQATLNSNRLIALYGGGLHVVVDLDEPADFLTQLRKTVDFKAVLSQCAQQ